MPRVAGTDDLGDLDEQLWSGHKGYTLDIGLSHHDGQFLCGRVLVVH